MKLNRDIVRQLLTLIAILAAFGVNVLTNIAPINGLSIGEISNTLFKQILITPANYAFLIWGLIYTGLISLAAYQAQPNQRQNPTLRRIGYLLTASSGAQIVWVVLFQTRLFVLSLGAMLLILLPLIGAYLRLDVVKGAVSRQQKWFVHRPISIYFAWISVATIVNGAIALDYVGWSGWGVNPQGWTVIMMVIGTAIAATVTLQRADRVYSGVFVWALGAIAVRHLDTVIIAGPASGFAFILILVMIFSRQIRQKST